MNFNYILFIIGSLLFTITVILGLIGALSDLDTNKLHTNYLLSIGIMVIGLGSEYFETKKKEIQK